LYARVPGSKVHALDHGSLISRLRIPAGLQAWLSAIRSPRHASLLGVDIGASSVKVAELRRDRDGIVVHAAANVPLPITEAATHDRETVIQALRQAIEMSGATTRRAALAIAGNALIIKTLTMPQMDDEAVEEQLAHEADQHVPHDVSELYMDFQILGDSRQEQDAMDVLFVACKRSAVEEQQALLAECDLELAHVDCAAFTVHNVAEWVAPDVLDDEGATAIVHLGDSMMHLVIRDGGRPAFVRDYFLGGRRLSEAMAAALGIPLAEAEQLKCAHPEEIPAQALDEFYQMLVAELARAMDFHATSYAGSPIARMLFSGGAAILPGFCDEMAGRMGLPAQLLQPFSVAGMPRQTGDWARDELRMIPALGLSLRAFA